MGKSDFYYWVWKEKRSTGKKLGKKRLTEICHTALHDEVQRKNIADVKGLIIGIRKSKEVAGDKPKG